MAAPTELIGGVLAFLSIPAAALVVLARNNLTRPGARGFVITVVGWAGWSIVVGLRLIVESAALARTLNSFAVVFLSTTVLGWAFLVAEYVRGRRIELTRRRLAAWLAIPVGLSIVAFTNPAHSLIWGEATRTAPHGTIDVAHGPAFTVAAAYWFLLSEGAALWLARDVLRSGGLSRRQGIALLIGHLVTVPFAYDVFGAFPLAPHADLSPVGFFLGSVVWWAALFRYGTVELAPIVREATLDEMRDAVVALDNDDVVVDVNSAASELFRTDGDAVGRPARRLFAEFEPLADCVLDDRPVETPLTLLVDGDRRHFQVTVSPVTAGGVTRGRLVVIRDVTELIHREKELATAKQVLSRVFRHDIRNDLTVIRGYAELIAERTAGETARMARTISETTEELAATANKARRIERTLEEPTEAIDLEVTSLLESSVESVRACHPDATYDVDLPAELWVHASTDLEAAFRNAVENAVVHNDGQDPTVRIRTRQQNGRVVVTVADDGPGIPDEELEVLERREEAPLSHASGVGLWLMTAIVERSDGDVAFDTGADGTAVTFCLPAATDRDRSERERPSDETAADQSDRAEPV
ncbi:histidine kinase N-terminal 7TM domain-containing protein [Halomicrobium salinisoli]|uniref:sensor histidine kinase n=1 Tax=Halomicrobium salinisoli TaxID=2878391 RepID=UPI001CF0860F|nr:histidine kinase N-terminal 7TM domain-containing protein [Halomicrobium salinisoli]